MKYRILLLFLICVPYAFLFGQSFELNDNPNIKIITTPDGKKLTILSIPGNPPKGVREPKAQLDGGSYLLQGVPAYDWSFGCGPTSAAMMAGYYDRNGYPNMYSGPTNGGVAPMDNSVWGSVVINGETRKQCPLSATRMGLDGRSSRGHVDDYWIKTGDSTADPFMVNGWAQHDYSDCTGDFMKTSQFNYGNKDGWSHYMAFTDGSPYTGDGTIYTYDTTGRCMLYGLQQFFLSRGYQTHHHYNQHILGFKGNILGFTFDQYKMEILSGRPVMIIVKGHMMLGVGFNNTNNKIYLHDTGDCDLHEMEWGGTYRYNNDDLQMIGVSVIQLQPHYYQSNASLISQVEYFYDQDPGFGIGNPIQIDSSLTASLELQLPMHELEDGIHLLHVRAKNAAGNWSVSAHTPFYKFTFQEPEIDAVEYFINTDPGVGNGTPIISQNNGITEEFSLNIPLSNLPDGIHNLFIRSLQTTGEWSITQKRDFFKYSILEPEVTHLEYFIDVDPGEGGGTPIAIQPNVSAEILTEIETTGLNQGIHMLYVRSKDNYNKWSLRSSYPFYIFPEREPLNIAGLEYFIDEDPGGGNGHSIALDSIVKTVHQSFIIDPACEEPGEHTIYFRGKDNRGAWSLSLANTIQFDLLPIEIIVNGPTTVCEGESVNMSINDLPERSYQWIRNGIPIQGALSSSFAAFESGDYQVIINHNNNCQDTSLVVAATTLPLPYDARAIIGNESACEASSDHVFSVNEIPYATTYNWSYSGSGASLFPNGNEVMISFASGATDGEISVYGSNTCGSGASSSKNFTISKRSIIAEALFTAFDTIVKGESTILSYEGGFAGTGAVAKWYTDGCMVNLVATGNNVEVSPNETTTYYMQFDGDCNSTPCLSLNVNVLPITLEVSPEGHEVESTSGAVVFQINSNSSWNIQNGDNWLSINQTSGNNDAEIVVQYDANYTESPKTAYLEVSSLDESIVQTVYIQQSGINICTPGWSETPNLQYNMSVGANILFDGQVSLSPNDMIGAFVGEECRGIASPMPDVNGLIFLTIRSDQASGEVIKLKLWDNNSCAECEASVLITFENMAEIGTLDNPITVSCIINNNLNFNFAQGYTWFSENLAPEDAHPNAFFEGLAACNNDRIIGQSSFSVYYNGSWNGSFTAFDATRSYRLKLCEASAFTATAPQAEIVPISLNSGYTWMGYLPQACLPVNEALANLTPAPTANDRLIGQSSFALFSGSQWVGSLQTLCPGAGYVMKLANAATLIYPEASANSNASSSLKAELTSPTGVIPAKNLQHSMTVLGQIELPGGQFSNNANDRVYAYINDQCVGIANPMETENGLIFLNVGENSDEAQQVSFKIWLDEEQLLYDANETLTFVPLKGNGAFENPFKFTIGKLVNSETDWFIGEPYPNPFSEETVVPLRLNEPATLVLKLYNSTGQLVANIEESYNTAGKHKFRLKKGKLNSGVYMLSVQILNQKTFLSKSKMIIIK